jgi:ketosteroid isomerase-like protein
MACRYETTARTPWRKTIDLIPHGSNELSAGCKCWRTRRRSANLKARYAALCDNQYDADGIASLFTEDAAWESPALGRFEGREAIRSFFQGASGIFSFAIHYSLNGRIEVEGDIARARWYLFMPCTVAAGNQAVWRAGIDHETYARVDGIWMFRHKRSEPLMSVPFETGWANTRFA